MLSVLSRGKVALSNWIAPLFERIATRSVSEEMGYIESLAYASGYDIERLAAKVALSG